MRDDSEATVYIACRDESLRVALARRISALDGVRVIADGNADEWTPPGAVITPVADTTPEICAALQQRGLIPLVLAALPNESQRIAFEGAGAIYLPMDLEGGELISALQFAPLANGGAG